MHEIRRQLCARAVLFGFASALASGASAGASEEPLHTIVKFIDIPGGKWVQIHNPFDTHAQNQRVPFSPHGGAAFDSRRGWLILIGSETHGDDWANAPRFFDVATRRWSQPHPDDDPGTYRVNAAGIPVAGNGTEHPWAMHVFGAVTYDRMRDRLVVASMPAHLAPGRFTDAVAEIWPRIRRHPTWSFDLATGRWRYLRSGPPPFFAHSIVYDYRRNTIVGINGGGVFELGNGTGEWRQIAPRGFFSWGSNSVYDGRHRAVIAFGDHTRRNDIAVFFTGSGRHEIMPTPGARPPPDSYVPMAFDERNGTTVVVVDRHEAPGDGPGFRTRAETWSYDLGDDRWTRLARADLPFPIGMNHHLVHDPMHGILLLVTNTPARGRPDGRSSCGWSGLASVWALRP